MSEPTGQEILDLSMDSNDANALTIREYLVALLYKLWDYGDDFSAHRPFGSSGWENDLYDALHTAGHITTRKDHYRGRLVYDTDRANNLIFKAINALGEKP